MCNEMMALEAREKRGAAFHEACHAAVIRHFGGYATPSIWRNESGNPDEKAWLGTCKMFAEPGAMAIADETKAQFEIQPAPENWRVLVGLAGIVGEQLLNGATDPEEISCYWDEAIEMGELSATDMAMVGDDHQISEVETVVTILHSRWAEIEIEAEGLAHE